MACRGRDPQNERTSGQMTPELGTAQGETGHNLPQQSEEQAGRRDQTRPDQSAAGPGERRQKARPSAQDADAQREPPHTAQKWEAEGRGGDDRTGVQLARELTWSHRTGWWRRSQRCWRRPWSPRLRRKSGLSWHWEGGEGEPAISPRRPSAPLTCTLHPGRGPCSHCRASCHHTYSGRRLSARPFPTLPTPQAKESRKLPLTN